MLLKFRIAMIKVNLLWIFIKSWKQKNLTTFQLYNITTFLKNNGTGYYKRLYTTGSFCATGS
jgi:hypothetical protein